MVLGRWRELLDFAAARRCPWLGPEPQERSLRQAYLSHVVFGMLSHVRRRRRLELWGAGEHGGPRCRDGTGATGQASPGLEGSSGQGPQAIASVGLAGVWQGSGVTGVAAGDHE
jgi:hypothetical protein